MSEHAIEALEGMAQRWFDGNAVYLQAENQPITMTDLHLLTAGIPSWSGQTVNEKTARGFVPFWACVRILSESIATLPMIVYRRDGDERSRATSNPAYYVLHNEANPYTTAVSFFETVQKDVVVWGNGYAKIQWDGAGRVAGLWQLQASQTEPRIGQNGNLYYLTTDAGGKQVLLDAADVVHVHGLGDDGVRGYRIVDLIKNAIGLGMSAEEFGARMFGQGILPGMVLQHPAKLSDKAIAHLRESLQARHGGSSKAWTPLITEEGIKAESFGVPPEDAQFLETRKFQAGEMASFFRIPPHMLGLAGSAQASNVAQQAAEFAKYTLAIWRRKWEQELNRKLFGRNSEFYCEFFLEELLRADGEARFRQYREAWQTGAMSQNEIRKAENMPPVDGGDTFFVPANMLPMEKALKDEPAPVAPAQPSVQPDDVMQDQDGMRVHVALLESVLTRQMAVETDRAAKGKPLAVEAVRAELGKALAGPAAAFVAFLRGKADAGAVVSAWLDKRAGSTGDEQAAQLAAMICEAVKHGQG